MQSDFAEGFVNAMLGWMRSLAAAVANMFKTGSGAQSGGFSFIDWFKANWLGLLIALILLGVIIDWVVWLLRWRPYWLWFKKRRVVLDDSDEEPVYEPKDRFHSRALKFDDEDDGEEYYDEESEDEEYYDDDEEYDDDGYYDDDEEEEEPYDGGVLQLDGAEDFDDEILSGEVEDGANDMLDSLGEADDFAEVEDDGKKDVLNLFEDGEKYERPESEPQNEKLRRLGESGGFKSRKARRKEKGARDDR